MNRAEFLEVVELYAALALSPEEMRAADAFLREDADEECRAALRRAQRTWAALGASVEPVRPDERVWAGIEQEIRGHRRTSRAGTQMRERLSWAAAACAIIALSFVEARREAAVERAVSAEAQASASIQRANTEAASASQSEKLLTATRSEREACAHALEAARGDAAARQTALAILQSPGARVLPLAPQAGSTTRATAVLDLPGHRIALLASAMPAAVATDYELWIIRGNDKIAAGLLKPDASGSTVLVLDQALIADKGKIDALAVTLEPAGGSTQPRGPILLVAALKG